MEHILAIDAGGSKCAALLIDQSGGILGAGHSLHPGLSGRHPRSIAEAISAALAIREFDVLHVMVHSRGLPLPLFDNVAVRCLKITSCNEVDPALDHAGVDHGVVLLAGTGAFAYGKTADGRQRHLDGSGPILGDFGGGYHIGTMALHAIVRSDWHARHETSLRRLVLERFGASCPYALFNRNLFGQDRSVVASIAHTVIEEAAKGDTVSRSILVRAARSLGETFRDLVAALGIMAESCTVVGVGGIIRSSDLYWEELTRCIAETEAGFTALRLRHAPVASLALFGLRRLLGWQAPPAVERLLAELDDERMDREPDWSMLPQPHVADQFSFAPPMADNGYPPSSMT